MPHKKNPIRSERICGLARVVRSYVTPVTEGIPLWHERDISHSSVERIALPDAAIATDYLLHLTIGLVEGLVVDAARMRANMDVTHGLLYSSSVLLELVSSGLSREDAYALVQAAAMETWDTQTPFRDSLIAQGKKRNMVLDEVALDRAFRAENYVARLGHVFDRLATSPEHPDRVAYWTRRSHGCAHGARRSRSFPSDRSCIHMTKGTEIRYRVRGGAPLRGTVFIQGAKNAALKMIAAALLTDKGRTVLRNVPPIEDVRRAVELAQAIGARVEFHEAERTLVVDASTLTSPVLPAEIARRFRGSVLFVPALLHRFGEAVIEGVGGCNLGSRNLDFHYRGFARLGATVDEGESVIRITAPDGLRGAHLYLDTPSHTGTENLMMAASLAPGTTIIDNTAQEPEVLDMIAFLSKMGAEISGGGTGFITVRGVSELHGGRAHGDGGPDRRRRVRHGRGRRRRGDQPGRRQPGPPRRGPLEARADGRRVRRQRRGAPGAPGEAAAADQRDHQPVPRVRHRPAVADHDAGDDGRRCELHPRDDLRRPVHAGA